MPTMSKTGYRSTESKYKGNAREMYVTYDLHQKTRGGSSATYPKVKRVYIAGEVKSWQPGDFRKRTGRDVHGVRIEYEQSRRRYRRGSYTAKRGDTTYDVEAAGVPATTQRFAQIVELPAGAKNVQFHASAEDLPDRYRHARQRIR
jgi:hypothetical protein